MKYEPGTPLNEAVWDLHFRVEKLEKTCTLLKSQAAEINLKLAVLQDKLTKLEEQQQDEEIICLNQISAHKGK